MGKFFGIQYLVDGLVAEAGLLQAESHSCHPSSSVKAAKDNLAIVA